MCCGLEIFRPALTIKCEHVWKVLRMDVRVPLLCIREEDFTSEKAAEILTSSSEYLDKVISVPPFHRVNSKLVKLISSSQIQFVAVVSFYAYGIVYGGFPRNKINHTLFLYNAQSSALVIDDSIVVELYYL